MVNYREVVVNLLIKRDGNICTICRQEFSNIANPEVDHLVPKSLNGADDITNFRLVHSSCHRKRNHSLKEKIKITPFMRKKPILSGIYKVKDEITKKYLLILKEEWIKTGTLKEASNNMGLTYRQGRYLFQKSKLPHDPRLWDLT